MADIDALLFIDTNKYLDLYRTDKGKKLIAPLSEQRQYIFVTRQIVDEVLRRKMSVATEFLIHKSIGLKLDGVGIPDHLSGTSPGQGETVLRRMKEIHDEIKKVNKELDDLITGIVEKIGRSKDEVSKSLAPIFANAIHHSTEELEKARARRELGNPPGKTKDPIGDQLSWEQILTNFKGKKRLWIISRDGDYGTVVGEKGILNNFLYDELCQIVDAPEVYLFEDTTKGLVHFVETTGVTAEQRLTDEEVQEIEIEEKLLPRLPGENQRIPSIVELAAISNPGRIAELAAILNPGRIAELAAILNPGRIAELAAISNPGLSREIMRLSRALENDRNDGMDDKDEEREDEKE